MSKNFASLPSVANASAVATLANYNGIVSDSIEETADRLRGVLIGDLVTLALGMTKIDTLKDEEKPNFAALADFARRNDGVGSGVRAFLRSCGFGFDKENKGKNLVSLELKHTSEKALRAFFNNQKLVIKDMRSECKSTTKKEIKKENTKQMFAEDSQFLKSVEKFLKAQEKRVPQKAVKALRELIETHYTEQYVADYGKKA